MVLCGNRETMCSDVADKLTVLLQHCRMKFAGHTVVGGAHWYGHGTRWDSFVWVGVATSPADVPPPPGEQRPDPSPTDVGPVQSVGYSEGAHPEPTAVARAGAGAGPVAGREQVEEQVEGVEGGVWALAAGGWWLGKEKEKEKEQEVREEVEEEQDYLH